MCLGCLPWGGGEGSRVSEIVSAARAGGHEIESFCVEVTVPPVIAVREHAMWCDADALSDTNHCSLDFSRLHTCMHACICVHMHVCMYIYVYIYMYKQKCIGTYTYMYLHVHICISIYVYIHICMYVQKFTGIYICMYMV